MKRTGSNRGQVADFGVAGFHVAPAGPEFPHSAQRRADGYLVTTVVAARVDEAGTGVAAAFVRKSSAPAWWYVGVGLTVVLLFAIGPVWLQVPLTLVVFVTGLIAMDYGIRRNARPGDRAPWRAI